VEAVSNSQREHPRRFDRCIPGPQGAGSDIRKLRYGRYQGSRTGIVRPEFEYEVPIADAETILSTICGDDTLGKERFFVEDAGVTWHVDVYGGILNGVTVAEIELKHEAQALILPSWVGKEVTGDPFYKKINMRARALKGELRLG
jgi:CYTH domain-containing protein